ncbi:MAG TPA: AMP-binding protein [Burkholderiales bacterium]|nr:AMP-binding protein [Burkholderiales bacterium]
MPLARSLTLVEVLDRHAAERGASPALYYRERAVGYAALREESLRVARGLADLGIGAGDRVALWLPNAPAWLACLFACARLGAVALATNTRFRGAEMQDILGRSGARLLVYWPAFRGIDFSDIIEGLDARAVADLRAVVAYQEAGEPDPPQRVHGIAVHRYRALAERSPLERDDARADAGCVMFTTSGTTSAPKFVLHRQASIAQHMLDVARGFGYFEPGAVGLGVLPFCGTYGLCTALAPIAAGVPLAVDASFDAGRMLEAMRRYRVTNTNFTADMVDQLLAAARDDSVLRGIRFAGVGTGAPQRIEAAAARGLRIAGVYGSSEVQALFSHQNAIESPLAERALGGGHPISPYAEVRVRDVNTGKLCAHGDGGMLEIRAPSQMAEYFGNAQATREAIDADGFLRTGDLGCTLADGRIIYQARMGDVLRLSGFLVSPPQIEAVLAEHPAVAACQVIGLEREQTMRPYAFVVLRAGARFDEQELIAFARGRMARYKVPARVFALDEFPTTPSANAVKVQKAKLREMASALLAAGAS